MTKPKTTSKLDRPSTWTFEPTQNEVERVRDAYAFYWGSYGRAPDFNSLWQCMAARFDGDGSAMLKFWERTLIADMPRSKDVTGAVLEQVKDRWRRGKVDHILTMLGLQPLTTWDCRSITASLKSPEQLQRVGQELAKLQEEGFAFWDHEMEDPTDFVFSWHLRRRRDGAAVGGEKGDGR
jgi:hypothetical protein